MAHDQKMTEPAQDRAERSPTPRGRLLFVVTEDWFFASHFLGLARAARDEGYEVALVSRLSGHAERLRKEGFTLYALHGNRGSLSALIACGEMRAIHRAIRSFKPDLVHLIAMRAIALGGLIAVFRPGLRVVIAPTGLGFLFSARTRLAKLARSILKRLVAYFAWSGRARFVFENAEDPARFRLSSRDPLVTIIGGAGVDERAFPPAPQPAGKPIRLALFARMLRSKGILAAIEATQLARSAGADVELHLHGDIDPGNPVSLDRRTLAAAISQPGIHWHGHVADVASLWPGYHIAILLSEREGMPRMLAEAAASSRPIIANDVTGCREIVLHGVSGLLVPPGEPHEAAAAIIRLAGDADLRRRMGEAGRAHFETRFTSAAVNSRMLAVYAELLDPSAHG